ncbi:spike base protein, RCAP_Rcc01079 family [Rhizobium metallidurans]|uniref:Uncharacterized protein n=1 Tax=Rhizobium metallidurans TaxID=1265931 RepID=A0A7W6GEU8_9HYPH|nr:hypothetical protein [Rhizobium metallidurans]MBB3967061.1 hypothetical protein [Rhizobium metallidurans]
MSDRFASHTPSLTGPASTGFAITPDDTLALPETTRALYVGFGGSVAVEMASGAVLTFQGVADGALLPLRVARVRASGTTASGVIGLV